MEIVNEIVDERRVKSKVTSSMLATHNLAKIQDIYD
jgi:hypothetical protein